MVLRPLRTNQHNDYLEVMMHQFLNAAATRGGNFRAIHLSIAEGILEAIPGGESEIKMHPYSEVLDFINKKLSIGRMSMIKFQ